LAIRLVADADCRVCFAIDPKGGGWLLPAGVEAIRTVYPDGGLRLCVILARAAEAPRED
jgi:hypothetical protein